MQVDTLTPTLMFYGFECHGCGGTIACPNGICFDCALERLKVQTIKKSGLYCGEDHPEPGC